MSTYQQLTGEVTHGIAGTGTGHGIDLFGESLENADAQAAWDSSLLEPSVEPIGREDKGEETFEFKTVSEITMNLKV